METVGYDVKFLDGYIEILNQVHASFICSTIIENLLASRPAKVYGVLAYGQIRYKRTVVIFSMARFSQL